MGDVKYNFPPWTHLLKGKKKQLVGGPVLLKKIPKGVWNRHIKKQIKMSTNKEKIGIFNIFIINKLKSINLLVIKQFFLMQKTNYQQTYYAIFHIE